MRACNLLRRSRRGFLIIVVLALIMVLLIMALGLSVSGRVTLTEYLRDDVVLDARETAEDAEALVGAALLGDVPKSWGQTFPPSKKVAVQAAKSRVKMRFLFDNTGKNSLYQQSPSNWAGNISAGYPSGDLVGFSTATATQACNDLKVPPWITMLALDSPTKHPHSLPGPSGSRFLAAYSAAFPYAIYAPSGRILVNDALDTWSNPTVADAGGQASTEAAKTFVDKYRVALPVLLCAHDRIEVKGKYPYGRAYSDKGPIMLPAQPTDATVGVVRKMPPETYASCLEAQIKKAASAISVVPIDRATWVLGDIQSFSQIWDLFTGNADWTTGNPFGLRQALSFPFPVIPSVKEGPDGLYTAFIFYTPFTADTASDGGIVFFKEVLDTLLSPFLYLYQCYESNENQCSWEPSTWGYCTLAGLEWVVLSPEFGEVYGAYMALQIAAAVTNSIFGQPKKVPETIAQEHASGWSGWAYQSFFADIGNLVGNLVSGDWSALPGDLIGKHVRMVHFGDRAPNLQYDSYNGFTWMCTMSVPRGRTLRYDTLEGRGTVTINGNLWIQRGATLVINGNLVVQDPSHAPNYEGWPDYEGDELQGTVPDSVRPCGRVILEEGATLLVSGNLSCEGSAELGSVTVCSAVGPTHPITSAIICYGSVHLRYGTSPGIVLDDLVSSLGSAGQKVAQDVLTPLLEYIVPNVSKVVSAFVERECWFATYATTFEVYEEIPVPGLDILPFPIPMPYENCSVKFFKILTKVYHYELNAFLGPYFVTHANWWPLGYGVAPVITKVDLNQTNQYAQMLASITGDLTDFSKWESDIGGFVSSVTNQLATRLAGTIATTVATNLISGALPGANFSCSGSSSTGKTAETLEKAVEKAIKKLVKDTLKSHLKEAVISILTNLRNGAFAKLPTVGKGPNARRRLEVEVQGNALRTMMLEQPGVLVYAGQYLVIGPAPTTGSDPLANWTSGSGNIPFPSNPCYCAAGMFVAHGNVYVNSAFCLGSLLSVSGSVATNSLSYYPYFTRASLNVPQSMDLFTDLLTLPLPSSSTCVDIGADVYHLTAEGWQQ